MFMFVTDSHSQLNQSLLCNMELYWILKRQFIRMKFAANYA